MKVVALAGGVGGAKLAAGLQSVLPAGDLSVVVNTADDFDLWGLHICPDLDTVMYTLANIANPETGSSVMGSTALSTPRAPESAAVNSVSFSPERRRCVLSTWVARSLSPSLNQVSSP